MVKESGNRNSVSESHRCDLFCLGPLAFHSEAVGSMVCLSHGCRLAERTGDTFRNGVVFSSRPVRIQERIRLRVENDSLSWHGAMRVGFTNVPPSARSLPLPSLAIPNLTNTPGHWAAPVHESLCREGSELQFWVSHGGAINFTINNCRPHKLLTGVDLTQPLWAMIDIYGQTRSIFLLGSEKRQTFFTKRSCPAPERFNSPDVDNHRRSISNVSSLLGYGDECISCLDMEVQGDESCVVCIGKPASITLPCGHRCLCKHCNLRVVQQFGTCPLCRYAIRDPLVKGTSIFEAP